MDRRLDEVRKAFRWDDEKRSGVMQKRENEVANKDKTMAWQ